MTRAAWLLLAILAGSAGGATAGPIRPLLDWRAWQGGAALVADGPVADLLAAPLSVALDAAPAEPGDRWTLRGDWELLLRERKPSRDREIRRSGADLSWTRRRGDRWFGARLRREDLHIRLRNVHLRNDVLVAGRRRDTWRAGAGLRRGAWVVQGAVGGGEGLDASANLSCDLPIGRILLAAQLDRPDWTADQSIYGRRYVFRFPLRRETWLAGIRPTGDRWPRCRVWREVLVSDNERDAGDYNLLYWRTLGLEANWRPGWRDFELGVGGSSSSLNLKMLADDTEYVELRDGRLRSWRGGLRSPSGPGGIGLLVGFEEIRAEANEAGFEPWPFLFWDVFDPDKYILDDFDYRVRVFWLGLARRFGEDRGGNGSLDVQACYGWLSASGSAAWREKEWILWPFVFDLEPDARGIADPERDVVRLEVRGRRPLGGEWEIFGRIRQFVPVIREAGEPSGGVGVATAPGESAYVFGGMDLELGISWRPGRS